MKKTKKFISGLIAAMMMLSNMSAIQAEETQSNDNFWNYDLVSEDTKDIYADFPFLIDKCMGKDMTMSLDFQYLKNIENDDSVEVTVTNTNDSSVVKHIDLSSDLTYFELEDIENDKHFCISVSEVLGGHAAQYTGYIDTKLVSVDCPIDITIGDKEYKGNNGEYIAQVAVKKVGVQPVCNHSEDEDCNDNCKMASVLDFYEFDELNSEFYNSLDSDSYYELQFDATKDGYTEHYQGFISTYANGADLGIFTRGYTFSLSAPTSIRKTISLETSGVHSSDFDFENAYEYIEYKNVYQFDFKGNTEIVIKWVVPEDGNYIIETIGNVSTMWYEFGVDANENITDTPVDINRGKSGQNARAVIETTEGLTKYFVLASRDGLSGSTAFRIIRTDYNEMDRASSYLDEVQTNYDNGIFSNESYVGSQIRYNGDRHIYAYNTSSGTACIEFKHTTTNLKVDVCSISERVNGFDKTWVDEQFNIVKLGTKSIQQEFPELTKEIHLFEIYQSSIPKIGSSKYFDYGQYSYDFAYYDSMKRDDYDISANYKYGDSPAYPVQITSFPYENNERTIHKGESDWFSFTTGETGGCLNAKLYETDGGQQYNILLYENIDIVSNDPPEWNLSDSVGTSTYVKSKTKNEINHWDFEYNNLIPNNTYYIRIARPNSSTYSSYYKYKIEINISSPDIPSATLSDNVSLTHTIGETITMEELKNEVMAHLTCYLNETIVPEATALDDVELYYNDVILTPDVINTLSQGTYNITVKYKDVAATGGSVTLTVNTGSSGDEIVIIENLPIESVTTQSWDWAAAAKILANTRLLREGETLSTVKVAQGVKAVKTSGYTTRGTIEEVVKAANYFYSGGSVDTDNFINDIVDASTAERTLASSIEMGQAVVMQLTSISNPNDLSMMRYVVLYGVNLTKHEYMVYDPIENETYSVSKDVMHTGGYNGNNDIKFTGQVIEFI